MWVYSSQIFHSYITSAKTSQQRGNLTKNWVFNVLHRVHIHQWLYLQTGRMDHVRDIVGGWVGSPCSAAAIDFFTSRLVVDHLIDYST